ncbi:MAG: DM13 domain-containing protein [Anaerolineales bacterium]|nr:DM13 domain-containing protein [Anaerolineales bacterium]
MNRRPIRIAIVSIGLLLVLSVGWYLASPLFINKTVNEALPQEVVGLQELIEAPSDEELAQIAEEARKAMAEASVAELAGEPDKVMEEEMPASANQAAVLRTGRFVDADEFHSGSGTATIYRAADGSLLLRLEDFRVTNGPDLHVLLANGAKPTGTENMGQFLDLGELKGNVGNQNYEIPADTDLGIYNSVIIYCQPFEVVFSTATLSQ